MEIGMLWFDNDPKTDVAEKIIQASAYYHRKYGKVPDLCFVHPTMLPSGNNGASLPAEKLPNIKVRPSKSVRPNYFWIGVTKPAGEP